MEETVKTNLGENELDRLKAKTRALRDSFTKQLGNLGADTNQVIKVGLVAVGLAVGAYIVIKLASSSSKKSKSNDLAPVRKSSGLPIIDMIKNAMASFLLGIARDKMVAFIEKMNQADDQAHTGTTASKAQ